jgi:hypothetical protein
MNWYKSNFIKLAFSGEWWITEGGSAMYADGDIGDMNHEAYVVEGILSQHDIENFDIYNVNDFLDRYCENYPEICLKILSKHLSSKEFNLAKQKVGTREFSDIFSSRIDCRTLLKHIGMTDEEINVVFGKLDGREYAMKNWGWKRMAGTSIETWTMTSSDLKAIERGIEEAYGNSYAFDEDDNKFDQTEFEIYVYSTNKYYDSIPFSIIASNDPITVNSYGRGMNAKRTWANTSYTKVAQLSIHNSNDKEYVPYMEIGHEQWHGKKPECDQFLWAWDGEDLHVIEATDWNSHSKDMMKFRPVMQGRYDNCNGKRVSVYTKAGSIAIWARKILPTALLDALVNRFGTDIKIYIV